MADQARGQDGLNGTKELGRRPADRFVGAGDPDLDELNRRCLAPGERNGCILRGDGCVLVDSKGVCARRVSHPPSCRHLSAIGGAKWVPHHTSRWPIGHKTRSSRAADPFGTQRSPVDIRRTRPGQEGYLTRRQKTCRHI
jgi:hypothetical protein